MDTKEKMPRLVVTGVNDDKRSTVASDASLLAYKDYPELDGLRISDIWKTTHLPSPLDIPHAANTHTVGPNIDVDLKGFNVRYILFPPHSEYDLHSTPTIDFAVVLSGQIVAVLEEQEVVLEASDIFVQRATHHGWKNESDEACAMLFFIVGAR
jgi:quercetin dioxygenase-like cupin family protein